MGLDNSKNVCSPRPDLGAHLSLSPSRRIPEFCDDLLSGWCILCIAAGRNHGEVLKSVSTPSSSSVWRRIDALQVRHTLYVGSMKQTGKVKSSLEARHE